MSRSVRQDYDKLRTIPHHVFVQEGGAIRKIGMTIPVSWAVIFEERALSDSRYEQKARKTIVAPTSEDWAKYHLAKRALLTLKAYENTTGAEEVEIPCPKPKTEYEFLETVDEWLDRCRALQAEAEQDAA
jgi:hypothetical protein